MLQSLIEIKLTQFYIVSIKMDATLNILHFQLTGISHVFNAVLMAIIIVLVANFVSGFVFLSNNVVLTRKILIKGLFGRLMITFVCVAIGVIVYFKKQTDCDLALSVAVQENIAGNQSLGAAFMKTCGRSFYERNIIGLKE